MHNSSTNPGLLLNFSLFKETCSSVSFNDFGPSVILSVQLSQLTRVLHFLQITMPQMVSLLVMDAID